MPFKMEHGFTLRRGSVTHFNFHPKVENRSIFMIMASEMASSQTLTSQKNAMMWELFGKIS